MPIYLGTSKIKDLFLGTQKIKEVWLGTQKVYSSSSFPEGYTRYDYLRRKNVNNAFVQMDVPMNVTTTSVIDLWVSATSSGTTGIFGIGSSNNGVYYHYAQQIFYVGSATNSVSAPKGNRHELTVTVDRTNSQLKIAIGQNEAYVSSSGASSDIRIGHVNTTNIVGTTYYYGVKIYDSNNRLIRDLVPAKRDSDSRSGFVNLAYNANDADFGEPFYKTYLESAMYAENEA